MPRKVIIYRLIGTALLVFFLVKVVFPIIADGLFLLSALVRKTMPYSIMILVVSYFGFHIYCFFNKAPYKSTRHTRHHFDRYDNDHFDDLDDRFDDFDDRYDDFDDRYDDFDDRYDDFDDHDDDDF